MVVESFGPIASSGIPDASIADCSMPFEDSVCPIGCFSTRALLTHVDLRCSTASTTFLPCARCTRSSSSGPSRQCPSSGRLSQLRFFLSGLDMRALVLSLFRSLHIGWLTHVCRQHPTCSQAKGVGRRPRRWQSRNKLRSKHQVLHV